VLAFGTLRALAETPTYVGVLEGPTDDASSAVSARTHVRIAFRKDGAEWKAMPGELGTPESLQWTVVFDGRTLGTATSRNPGELHWYADVGTHILTSRAAPEIRTDAADFRYGSGARAKARPLLLISGPDASATDRWDPQGWKRSALSGEERLLAIAAFRSKVPDSERCARPEEQPIHRVRFADSAVTIVKAYRDNGGEVLFGARLQDPRANCGFFDDETFFDYWFVIDAQHRVRYLDSQMEALDAADLDHRGKSAWLFFTSRGEDEDGYELFYDDFRKRVQFQWIYH
jgi:hypothetical protein